MFNIFEYVQRKDKQKSFKIWVNKRQKYVLKKCENFIWYVKELLRDDPYFETRLGSISWLRQECIR